MNKKLIPFPLVTKKCNQQNNPMFNSKEHRNNEKKDRNSVNLLKLINEDLKKISKKQCSKLPHLQRIINSNKNSNSIRIQGRNKKLNQIQQNRLSNGKQLTDKMIKRLSFHKAKQLSVPTTARNELKSTTVQKRKRTIDVQMTTQKVIVAKNRKQFSRINQDLLYERRQNYLNANFNKRKDRLSRITKQNKKIYQKINSQRSSYSIDDLNKSYESNASISRRLSNSKISQRSRLSMSRKSMNSSRCSVQSNNGKKKTFTNRDSNDKRPLIKIESKSINQIKYDQIQKFVTLFPQAQKQSTRIRSNLSKKNLKYNSIKQNDQQQAAKQNNYSSNKLKQLSLIRNQMKNQPRANNIKQYIVNELGSNQVKKNIFCSRGTFDLKRSQNLNTKKTNILSSLDQNQLRSQSLNKNRVIMSSRNSYNLLQKIEQEPFSTVRAPFSSCLNTNAGLKKFNA